MTAADPRVTARKILVQHLTTPPGQRPTFPELLTAILDDLEPHLATPSAPRAPVIRPGQPPLTPQQHVILRAIAAGGTNAEIGARVHLTEHTVKSHFRRLREALGARDRAHAVHIGPPDRTPPMTTTLAAAEAAHATAAAHRARINRLDMATTHAYLDGASVLPITTIRALLGLPPLTPPRKDPR